MSLKETPSAMVHCDTCGKEYANNVDRCPRCRSNQKSESRAQVDIQHCRRSSDLRPQSVQKRLASV